MEVAVMELQRCNRCKCREVIPTYQYVKFDDKVRFLCSYCWDAFKRWFYYGKPEDEREPQEEVA